MPPRLTYEIITAAILGFEEQKRQIDTKIAELPPHRKHPPGSGGNSPQPLDDA